MPLWFAAVTRHAVFREHLPSSSATSFVRTFISLVLRTAGNLKAKAWSGFRWHVVHTKFQENPFSCSSVVIHMADDVKRTEYRGWLRHNGALPFHLTSIRIPNGIMLISNFTKMILTDHEFRHAGGKTKRTHKTLRRDVANALKMETWYCDNFKISNGKQRWAADPRHYLSLLQSMMGAEATRTLPSTLTRPHFVVELAGRN